MNSEDVKTAKELLERPQSIIIVPHKNPDGDALGSCLALWHYLKHKGQQAWVISPNDYPRFLKWMPGTEAVLNFEREEESALEKIRAATLIFTLDFNHLSRTGQMQPVLEESHVDFVMIDHHQAPDTYALLTFSDTQLSSTSEMVYQFIDSLGDSALIGPEVAQCLYAGILTDTGSFKYASTSSDTHRVAAALIDKGARNTQIQEQIFDTFSPDRLRLLGCALANIVILPEYNTAYLSLSQDELDKHNYKKGDTEGFVNYGLTLEGIRFAAIFIENRDENLIKISFRSVGSFSVNEFARAHFSGGGHTNAAGGKSGESLQQTAVYFESLLPAYKKELTT